MNPFEKLRRAVDKVNIQYQIPQQTKYNQNFQQVQNQQLLRKTKSKSTVNQIPSKNDRISNIMLEQQTQYIQQINELSKKNQRLTKMLSMAEIQKQQLIQHVCVLEKNNQILEQQIRQSAGDQQIVSEVQRRYKQEIYRINKTVQALGNQLNSQRAAKKAAISQLNRFKQESTVNNQRDSKKLQQMQKKIHILQQQIQERSSMLEYNIKKYSEQKRQAKILSEKLKFENQKKFQELNYQIQFLKDQLNTSKNKCDLLSHKLETASQKADIFQNKHNILQSQNKNIETSYTNLQQSLRQANLTISHLTSQNDTLQKNLQAQQQNVKLKVVQIRDQTLQLQLQMYKRQCKQLLQQKAISQKNFNNRTLEPSYQFLQNKY